MSDRWIAKTRDGWYAVGEGDIEIAYCKNKKDAMLLKKANSGDPRLRRVGEPATLIMFKNGAPVQIYRTGQRGVIAGRTGDNKIVVNGEGGQVHKFHPATRAIPLDEAILL
jgi:hypothetical protein